MTQPSRQVDKRREAEFFDRQYSLDNRRFFDSNYSVAESSHRAYEHFLLERCAGRDVLEYGCGASPYGIELAKAGARLTGIDISPVAIEQARTAAAAARVEAEFAVMDGDELALDDDSFDIVCGSGILHHLELQRSAREIARVLRPDGVAVFREPLGLNPVINLARRLSPGSRTDDERPMRLDDIATLGAAFRDVRCTPYHAAVLLAIPFKRTRAFRRLVRRLDAADRSLLGRFPRVGMWLGWLVIIELGVPEAHARSLG